MKNKKDEKTKQNIFEVYNLKRCESVLFKGGCMFLKVYRDEANDMKEGIAAVYDLYKRNGETKEVLDGFLCYEKILTELSGGKEYWLDNETTTQKINAQRSARYKCHPSYSTGEIAVDGVFGVGVVPVMQWMNIAAKEPKQKKGA